MAVSAIGMRQYRSNPSDSGARIFRFFSTYSTDRPLRIPSDTEMS